VETALIALAAIVCLIALVSFICVCWNEPPPPQKVAIRVMDSTPRHARRDDLAEAIMPLPAIKTETEGALAQQLIRLGYIVPLEVIECLTNDEFDESWEWIRTTTKRKHIRSFRELPPDMPACLRRAFTYGKERAL
jgi:hypothetical protein